MKESEKMANVMDKGHKSGLMEVSISEMLERKRIST